MMMSRSDRFTLALCWAQGLGPGAQSDENILAWARSQTWGPESGHLVAQVLRHRGLHGTVGRWWPACPAGTGSGSDEIRT